MGAVYSFHRQLDFETIGPCGTCGIEMAMTSAFVSNRRRDHERFYCPNGHPQVFRGKSREEELKEELALAQERADRAEKRRREDTEAAHRQVAAARGQVTRIRNRVGNGVCPCCNRSFTNLQRHMHTKHPGYAHEENTDG